MQLGLGLGLGRYRGETNLVGEANVFQDATVAYSLRDLGLRVTSNVVRVRRSNDNLEQDFTATQITDGTLASFCGVGDGFVSVWYDQKGLFNLEQNIAIKQPKLLSLGSLNIENGKPIIRRASDNASMLSSYPINSAKQIFGVSKITYTNQLISCFISSTNESLDFNFIASQQNVSPNNNVLVSNIRINSNTETLPTRNDVYNTFSLQKLISYNSNFTFKNNNFGIGYRNSDTINIGMFDMQELILFETPKNIEEIEAKINNHYAIY